MKPYMNFTRFVVLITALVSITNLTNAILVQPYNYMLDDSSLVEQQDDGSLSPFYNDQSNSREQSADKDIISIIGERLARLRYARMLENQDETEHNQGHYSPEMAEFMNQNEQQAKSEQTTSEQALPSSMAGLLLNVAQAVEQASAADESNAEQSMRKSSSSEDRDPMKVSSRGSVMELDTSPSASVPVSMPSKSDLKTSSSGGSSQWFNPKETIPVLKISSMATPSKYKKVYFRSEKKLVDGAFHSPTSEKDEKKSFLKPFNSAVQRRSSRGTSSSAPPSPLQDGVIEFLKKFRDVYIQTRPVSTASGSSSLASNFVSAAASSPLASILSPSGSRPNLASALSAASSMVNGVSMVAQAASSSSPSTSSSSGTSGTAAAASSSSSTNKSPLTAQSYVSFWSKTFPNWVKKMLKQMRRRSLYNSKRQQQMHQHHHHSAHAIGQAAQAAAASAVVNAVELATSGGSGSNTSQSSSSR